jgi:hypothetical protein
MESMIILPVMAVGRGATMVRLWLEAAGPDAVGAAIGTTLIAAVAARKDKYKRRTERRHRYESDSSSDEGEDDRRQKGKDGNTGFVFYSPIDLCFQYYSYHLHLHFSKVPVPVVSTRKQKRADASVGQNSKQDTIDMTGLGDSTSDDFEK